MIHRFFKSAFSILGAVVGIYCMALGMMGGFAGAIAAIFYPFVVLYHLLSVSGKGYAHWFLAGLALLAVSSIISFVILQFRDDFFKTKSN